MRGSPAIQRVSLHRSRDGSEVFARDLPRVQVDGYDTQHTLVLGHDSLISSGVTTHDLGLAGNLARQLALITHCGQLVDVAHTSTHALKAVTAAVRTQPLWRFDAIVVCVNTAGPFPMFSGHSEADAVELVRELDRACPTGTRAVIAADTSAAVPRAAHRMSGLVPAPPNIAAALQAECARSAHVDFVELRVAPVVERADAPSTLDYRARAELVADRITETVEESSDSAGSALAGSARDYRDRPQREVDRQGAVAALRLRDSLIHPHLRKILDVIKAGYGTRLAALNIVDGETQWTMAVAGGELLDVARHESFCAVSIDRDCPMIIPDAAEDLRFQGFTSVRSGEIRFYAGVPIESPGGLRIGALCILDPEPRTDIDVDPLLLSSAAHQVEKLIWEHAKSL